jgi:hypothetical protein
MDRRIPRDAGPKTAMNAVNITANTPMAMTVSINVKPRPILALSRFILVCIND